MIEISQIETVPPQQPPRQILTPHRILALSEENPTLLMLTESTIAYMAGCTLLIENVRTLQQHIVWVGRTQHDILRVECFVATYGPMRVGVLVRNVDERVLELLIFVVDWSNYFYRTRDQRVVRLSDMGPCEAMILKFDTTGDYLCLTTQQKDNNFFTAFPMANPKKTHPKQLLPQKPMLIYSYSTKNQSFFMLVFSKFIQIRTREGQQLWTTDTLYTDQENGLLSQELVMEMHFKDNCVGEVLGFVLGDQGSLVIFKIGEGKFEGLFRIDARVHQNSMRIAQKMNEEQQSVKPLATIKFIEEPLLLPTCFNISSNRILLAYPHTRKLIYLTFSLLNHRNYTSQCSQDKIFLPRQNIQQSPMASSCKAVDLKVESISISSDLCSTALMVHSEGYRYVVVLDVLGLLVPGDGTTNGSLRVYGNYSGRGVCRHVAYLERSSQLFILYQNVNKECYLSYYQLPYPPELTQKPPSSLLIWSNMLKTKAISISAHPINSTILILYPELARIHYYTHQKLSQNYININIPNCECGSYSPLGDKIVMCNVSGVYVLDAYTMEMRNFVPGWGGAVGKAPKGIIFVGDFDLIMEYGMGTGSYLLQLCDYSKIRMLGQVSYSTGLGVDGTTDQTLVALYNRTYSSFSAMAENSQNTIQIDLKHELIAYVAPTNQLRIYNLKLQILNIMSISPTCILLNREMQILFVGTTRGELYMFRWPEIADKISNVREIDPDVIAVRRVHCEKIVAIHLSINLRYVIVVSGTGQISFLEFQQENSANISRQGALAMLKKSTLKPSLQNCLTSNSDQNKRTQAIIKAVGKQVQVNKKNQKACSDLVAELQHKIREQKFRTELMIKDEIDCSDQEKKIRNLVRRIEKMRKELTELDRKSQLDVMEEKEGFKKLLKDNFREKDQLQKQIQTLKISQQSQLAQTASKYECQLSQTISAQQTQLQIIAQDTTYHKNMQQKYQSYNNVQFYKLDEQKIESQAFINYEYNVELKALYARRNQLMNSIRKYSVLVPGLHSKNTGLSMQAMEITEDIEAIGRTRVVRQKNRQQLSQKLKQIKNRNQLLIFQHRQIDASKEEMEKKAIFVEQKYQKLVSEIKGMEGSYQDLKAKKLELDGSFYDQNRRKLFLNSNIEQMRDKIAELKEKRDKIKRKLAINSNKLSQSLHISSKQTPKSLKKSAFRNNFTPQNTSLHISNNPDLEQYDQCLYTRNCTNQKLQKLNKIKNEKIRRYKLINNKLINDHKRLISQLNELKRYNDFLIKKEERLKLQIRYGSLSISSKQNMENRCGTSVGIKKISRIRKGAAISLHQDGSINHQ